MVIRDGISGRGGHLAGDDLLGALAGQLRVVVGGRAMACRLGGDELMLMLPGTSLHAAVELAEGLRRRFEREPVVADSKPMSATLSLGIAAVSYTHLAESSPACTRRSPGAAATG